MSAASSSSEASHGGTEKADVLRSAKFADAPLTVTMNNERYNYFQGTGSLAFTGDYTISLVSIKYFGAPLRSPDGRSEVATSDGQFIGIRYKIENHTSAELPLNDAFGGQIGVDLTDGTASWSGSASSNDAIAIIDAQTGTPAAPETVAPGSSVSSWAVFTAPKTAAPKGLVVGLDSDKPIALGLPPAG
jgi:hypothetical protein